MKIDLPQKWQIQLKENESGLLATIFELGHITNNHFIDMKKYIQVNCSKTNTIYDRFI